MINFSSVRIFVTIRGKRDNRNRETVKVGICMPLKLHTHFRFVSDT